MFYINIDVISLRMTHNKGSKHIRVQAFNSKKIYIVISSIYWCTLGLKTQIK